VCRRLSGPASHCESAVPCRIIQSQSQSLSQPQYVRWMHGPYRLADRHRCTVDLSDAAAPCVGVTAVLPASLLSSLSRLRLSQNALTETSNAADSKAHHWAAALRVCIPLQPTCRHTKHSTSCLTSVANNCMLSVCSYSVYSPGNVECN